MRWCLSGSSGRLFKTRRKGQHMKIFEGFDPSEEWLDYMAQAGYSWFDRWLNERDTALWEQARDEVSDHVGYDVLGDVPYLKEV